MSDSTVPVAQTGEDAHTSTAETNRAGELADGLIRDFHPVSALDVGGTEGQLVAALRERGVDASEIDLSEPLSGRFGLVTCIDALDGLSPGDADQVVTALCKTTDTLVLSVAGAPENWAVQLAGHGFLRRLDRDLSYISDSATVFVRGDEDRAETVRRYDRAWWQLRGEVAEVRRALQEQRARLAGVDGKTASGSDSSELAGKLAESEAEVLRLRDLLIGKEAELGVAAGRAAELEAQAGWIEALKHRRNQIRGAVAKIPGAKRLRQLIRRR